MVRVAESGVRDRSDAAALAEAGYHALLVGETLVTSGDPAGRSVAFADSPDAKVVAPPERASSFHRVFVKICGVTSEEDGLLAVGMGAGAIGLNFVPGSKRQIAVDRARDIVRRLRPKR